MDTIITKTLDLKLTQIAWVVKDIDTALRFFQDGLGLNFSKVDTIRVKEFGATLLWKSHLMPRVSSQWLIQAEPLLNSFSLFREIVYSRIILMKNPAGGIQHIAYSIPVDKLNKIISEFSDKGFPVISSFDHPIAKIVFF
jgi:hypothetical protein